MDHAGKTGAGCILLLAERYAAAEKAFREDLGKFPNNGWSLHGLMTALEAQNKDEEAASVQAELELAWASADVKLE